MAGLNLTV